MQQPVYTSIPDTTDTNYWEAKPYDSTNRSRTFVPKNKELHMQLKQQQRDAIKKPAGAAQRKFDYKPSLTGILPKGV